MANDDISQELAKWKDKYYQSLSDFEKQQHYDELLQRSLGRLALAAQGLDASLDAQLKSLRSALKKKNNHSQIEIILERMEQAISKMDADAANKASAAQVLSELLTSIKFPKSLASQAKKLNKKIKADKKSAAQQLPEVLQLLDEAINLSSAESSGSGFGFSLFGNKSSKKEQAETDNDNAPETELGSVTIDDHDDNRDNGTGMPNNLLLMKLLERLSLPTDLSKKTTKIRHKLEKGVEDDELPAIISDIADIVSSLGSQAITEKQEYEAFLQALTDKLQSLDEHIRQTNDHDVKAFEQRTAISAAVEQEVKGIRGTVEQASNLDQLKLTVSERLDALNQHFDSYKQSDRERFESSQVQINELNQRLKEMEKESVTLRQIAEQTREQALKDALTGIWNRQAFNENIEKEHVRWQRYQKPLSIVIWDVDFFKKVNDSYGHAAGDKVLKTIAQIFLQATRNADFIARYGGEEFVGIFPETRLEDALKLANKIREKVQNSKFHYENEPVPITASAGLATFRPGDTVDTVFKRADSALYKAKQSGRNKCISED